jgi:hypothetical protein
VRRDTESSFVSVARLSPTPLHPVPRQLFLDIAETPVAPKMVLPISAQGPWESRRLWRHAATELSKRPKVDWDAVDREKGHLEEEQRLLPCHAKVGSADYKDWKTKKFHLKK